MYKKMVVAGLTGIIILSVGVMYWRSQLKLGIHLKALTGLSDVIPVAIVGSGPAGLSAALYATRLGYHTVVFEGRKPGGQLTETTYIENWPGVGKMLGPQLMNNVRAYVSSLGALLVPDTIVAIDVTHWPFVLRTDDGAIRYALSLIIATGSAPRVLDVPGEREYWGKGVTTCALCDAPFYKGKQVVVVGGGDTACEQATQIAPYARHVTLLVRKGQVRASAVLFERVRALNNVTIAFNREITKIMGNGAWVTGVHVIDTMSHKTAVLPVDGIFLAIGHEPYSAMVAQQVACNERGYIVVRGRSQATSMRGVFAAGEVEDSAYCQAGVAAGDGIKAAIDASRFLTEIGWLDKRQHELGVQFFVQKRAEKSAIIAITSVQQFEQLIKETDKPVVVDFYAHHCPSCMHMLPAFQAVAQQFARECVFASVDTVQVPELEAHLKVARIPCFIIFKQGQAIARYYALMTKPQLAEMVRRVL